MGHMLELVITWAVLGLVIGLVAGIAGWLIRAVGKRAWSDLRILEGAIAFGAVLGFVALIFLEVLRS